MSTLRTHVTKLPWYRIDVFRRCKTGEVIEATPWTLAAKLRWLALCLLFGAPFFFAVRWFSKTWIPRYYAELHALARIDPVASARKLAQCTSLLLFVPVLFGVVAGSLVLIRAARLVRAGRRPLPGEKVRVRTEVVAGWWCVQLPAIMWGALALACMLAVWCSYVRVVAMFWDGYRDAIAAPAPVARGHAATEKLSGADFDIMMRAHHDATDLDWVLPRIPMRTTIDIAAREHALFSALAHDHGTSLSKVVVEMQRSRGGVGDALDILRGFIAHPAHRFWPEDVGYDTIRLDGVLGRGQVTDAYLAALARKHRGRLATLDRGLAALHHDVAELIPCMKDTA